MAKILVFSGGNTVLRYTTTGALDSTFGNNGIVALKTFVGGSWHCNQTGRLLWAAL